MNWKAWFPSRKVGYATILSYAATSQRYIVKTIDGGLTWFELPLGDNSCEEFEVGFINDSVGWIGTNAAGFQTVDGGATWTNVTLGDYANKFQIISSKRGFTCYAIGKNVYKIECVHP